MLRLVVAAVAYFAAWSWMRAGFSAATSKGEKPAGSVMLLRGGVFAATLIWLTLAVTDAFGWLFGLAIMGGLTWWLTSRGAQSDGPSSSSSGDAGT